MDSLSKSSAFYSGEERIPPVGMFSLVVRVSQGKPGGVKPSRGTFTGHNRQDRGTYGRRTIRGSSQTTES